MLSTVGVKSILLITENNTVQVQTSNDQTLSSHILILEAHRKHAFDVIKKT